MSAALQLPIPHPASPFAPRLSARIFGLSAAAAAIPTGPSPTKSSPTQANPAQRKPVASIKREQPELEPPSIRMAKEIIARQVTAVDRQSEPSETPSVREALPDKDAIVVWAFYRKHTENMLRRYLYASLQVGRSPSLLGESVGRGWVSSRRVRTFEDAVIFVLDIERCIEKLNRLEQQLICRIVLQEYTQNETATFLGLCKRTVYSRFPEALDHLTELLVEADLLAIPD